MLCRLAAANANIREVLFLKRNATGLHATGCVLQLVLARGLSDGFLISSPSRMWGTLVGLCRGGELLRHVGVSCLETVVGFLAGTLLGTAIAICMWWREGVARVLSPYLVVLNALPKTALGPIFIVWMGAGMGSIIVMTLAISLIVTILSMYQGFLGTDSEKLRLMRSLGYRYGSHKQQLVQSEAFRRHRGLPCRAVLEDHLWRYQLRKAR